MKQQIFLYFFLLAALFALSACDTAGAAPGAATPTPLDIEPVEEKVSVAGCPEAKPGTHQLVAAAKGICFLYPDHFDVFEGADGGLSLYVRSLMNTEAPFASISFEAADGRSLEDVVAGHLAAVDPLAIEQQTMDLGGETALAIDNLPGQDTNRRIVAIHDGQVFNIMIARIGADYGPVGEEAEALSELITTSWQFTGIEPEAPLLAGPECPEPETGTTLFTNSEDGYCLLLPEGYTVDDSLTTETGGGETAVYMGSSLDTTHGRLFITVENGEGQSLEDWTQAKQEAFADFNVIWSFGYMLDGVMSNQFDQLPGQDLSRQVLAVHNDRLYTLTFLPDDPAAGDAYTTMQALYETVMDSFSFLWPAETAE